MNTQMQKLDTYLEELKKQGLKVPSQANHKQPNFRRISTASGIDYKFLTTPEGKSRITLTVGQIGLDTSANSEKLRRSRFEENSEYIGVYLRWLQAHGLRLPQHPTYRGKIFFAQVEAESGLQRNTLIVRKNKATDSHRIKLRKLIESAIPSLGMETRVLPQYIGEEELLITYELLLDKGTEVREKELKDKANSDQQLYNTRSSLKRFYKALNLDITAQVGSEFVADFNVRVEDVLSGIKNITSRRKFQTEIRWWFDYYQKLVKEASTPDDFQQAFARLVDKSGLNFNILRKLLGVSLASVIAWYRGTKTPRAKSFAAISKMESLCKLQSGSLVSKLARQSLYAHVLPSQLPDFLRRNISLARQVCPHLPDDFLELSPERQQLIFESVSNEIIKKNDPYSKKLAELQQLRYRLIEWPMLLQQEFADLASFKTAEMPPIGMKRDGRWRPVTEEIMRKQYGFFYGALSLPADADDVRLRGLGMPLDHLSIALIVCPHLVHWYVRFKYEAREGNAMTEICLLRNLIPMLKADTGWLRQKPELALRLRPVSSGSIELVSQQLVAKSQANWDDVCQDALDYYLYLCEELKLLIKVGRDPFLSIQGIINMDDPMNVFSSLIYKMRSVMPNRNTQPVHYHIAIRNCALILLIAITGLRRNTITQLNYTGDNKGHLFLQDGNFVLNIPRKFFKVENSPYFGPKHAQEDYNMLLPNVLGLNEVFSEYLEVSRPFLMSRYHPSCEDHPLFVTSKGCKSPRLSPMSLSGIYRSEVVKHLVENKWRGTGIPQVFSHGPHSARHIRGTASVIKTGSFQIAGDANHNSERMARRHYARFAPKNRNRRVNSVLFNFDD